MLTMREKEAAVSAIISVVRSALSMDDVAYTSELIDVGEPGIALEYVCVQLDESDLSVSASTLARVVEVGTAMGIDPSYWTVLRVETD